jgi:SET domain-containing protein
MPKKGAAKTPAKEPSFKFEDPYPNQIITKKNKNNKNGKILFAGFIILINNFGHVILSGFI